MEANPDVDATRPTPVEPRRQPGGQRLAGRWRRAAPVGQSSCLHGVGGHRVVQGARRDVAGQMSSRPAHPAPGPAAAVVVPVGEVLIVGRVDGPEVAFTAVAAAGLDEALVQGQVVTHAVPPVLILRGSTQISLDFEQGLGRSENTKRHGNTTLNPWILLHF